MLNIKLNTHKIFINLQTQNTCKLYMTEKTTETKNDSNHKI